MRELRRPRELPRAVSHGRVANDVAKPSATVTRARAGENRINLSRCPLCQVRRDRRVRLHRERELRVAEDLHRDPRVHAPRGQERRQPVPEPVQPEPLHADLAPQPVPGPLDVARLLRGTDGGGEDQPVPLPERPGSEPHLSDPRALLAQRLADDLRERDRPRARRRLELAHHQPLSPQPLHLVARGDGSSRLIDVCPAQPQELAQAQPEAERGDDQGLELVPGDRREELPGLGRGQVAALALHLLGRVGERGGVAGDEPAGHRVVERGPQHSPAVGDRARREPACELGVEVFLHVEGREPAQPDTTERWNQVAADRLPESLVGARRDRGPRRRLEPPLQERRHGLALGRGWLPVRVLCLRCLELGEGLSLGLAVERLAPALATDDPEVEHRDPEPIRRPLVDGTLATPAPALALVRLSLLAHAHTRLDTSIPGQRASIARDLLE